MFRVTFVAGVLFTATLVTNGTADAHLGRHHLSSHHGDHGPGIAHRAAAHRHRTRVAAHRLPRHHASAHRFAARHAGSRPETVGIQTAGIQTGGASYYQSGGHRTATGGSVGVATCAHRTLPFGTRVLVTNLANARAAVLTVNDRGPFVRGRIVDVSTAAAGVLGMLHAGIAQVRVRVIGPG